MSAFKKCAIVALLAVGALYPRTSLAMEVRMFDDMATQDQHDYLRYLVKVAQEVLTDQDHREQAAKLKEIFQKIPPGAPQSLGETQFEEALTQIRTLQTEVRFPFTRSPVESALFVTMSRNGVTPTHAFEKSLTERLREKPFWPKLPLHTK